MVLRPAAGGPPPFQSGPAARPADRARPGRPGAGARPSRRRPRRPALPFPPRSLWGVAPGYRRDRGERRPGGSRGAAAVAAKGRPGGGGRAASGEPGPDPRTAPARGSLRARRGWATAVPPFPPPDRRRGLLAHPAGGPGVRLPQRRRQGRAAAREDLVPAVGPEARRARALPGGPGGAPLLAGSRPPRRPPPARRSSGRG